MRPVLTSVRNMLGVAAAAVALAAIPAMSHATMIVLGEGNSVAKFNTDPADPGTPGLFEWDVDGVNHIQQQWFWYRVGEDTGEKLISSVAPTSVTTAFINGGQQPDLLRTVYNTEGLRFTVTYQLTGGAAGSGHSDLAEVIKIQNLAERAQSVHFFQYSDFNLNGTPGNDTTSITGGNTASMADGTGGASETVVVPKPSHLEVGLVPSTLTSLNDAGPTTLNDNAGPMTGDTSWAFQWDVVLQPGGSFIISKDKLIFPFPEPASLGLLAIGAITALGRRRRA